MVAHHVSTAMRPRTPKPATNVPVGVKKRGVLIEARCEKTQYDFKTDDFLLKMIFDAKRLELNVVRNA